MPSILRFRSKCATSPISSIHGCRAKGISRDEYLTTKFGSPERYDPDRPARGSGRAGRGPTYNVGGLERQPNTIDCHRLIQWAQSDGSGPQMKQRLMELYFTEGGDLSDREVLVKAAADCGLDARRRSARQLATDQPTSTRSPRRRKPRQNAGIQGVPFFIIGGKFGGLGRAIAGTSGRRNRAGRATAEAAAV